MSVEFIDNSDEILAAFEAAKARALERCGSEAEGHTQDLAPVDTGNLRNSIAHKVVDNDVSVGTNSEYAIYQEVGTGKHYPGGRPTPWSYQDAKGDWHRTSGNPPQPYLKPAVADYGQDYRNIIEDEMKNG